MKNDSEGKKIIQQARQFMRGKTSASWADYNMFKQRLISAGCYGYEKILADILNL